MKMICRSLATIFFILTAISLIAGEDPCSSTLMDPESSSFETFDNTFAGNSEIEDPPYGGYSGKDFWLSFIVPSSGYVNLILEGGTMSDPAIAIYEGPCTDPKLLYVILDNNCDQTTDPAASLDQLIPGEEYFVRVWAQDGSSNGSFSILLTQSTGADPNFFLYADAVESGDCIQLTGEDFYSHGCAWFEIPIDFTEAFTHDMTANFGDKDANGADGICLIYQTNGPDYCGGLGIGIGAEGIPNSAIFEFDTWQNTANSDPVNDHASFNINGDMNHVNSINGPVDLGNIEDGLDHTISFVYDGNGGYELFFDGILLFSGNYDFINDLFGGSTTAWWGYTAATGGANNLQVICPDTEDFELGTQEYVEVEICEGDEYNGYTEEGFYIDYEPGEGNCLHQINTNLIVRPSSEPSFLEIYICEGEDFEIENQYFSEPGNYEIETYTDFGCDSLIMLDLYIPELSLEILVPGKLDCNTASMDLNLDFESDFEIDQVDFIWDTPSGGGNGNSYLATEGGMYEVYAQIRIDTLLCFMDAFAFVEEDIFIPEFDLIDSLFIDCSNQDSIDHIEIMNFSENYIFSWYYDSVELSDSAYVAISGPGTYTIVVEDPQNGCKNSDSTYVELSLDIPFVQLFPSKLDCNTKSFEANAIIEGDITTISWFYETQLISNDSSVNIDQEGWYFLEVISSSACVSVDSMLILNDTIMPFLFTEDLIIPCNIDSGQISILTDSTNLIAWNGPEFIPENMMHPVINTAGSYIVSATDPDNGCITTDSLNVTLLGNSPEIWIETDTLNCSVQSVLIDLTTDQENTAINWSNSDGIIGNAEDVEVFESDNYTVEVISENGCISYASIFVAENHTYPEFELYADTLDCDKEQVLVNAIIQNGDMIRWEGPNNYSGTEASFVTAIPGLYYLTVTNSSSTCISFDSILVIDKSNRPIYELTSDTLNCYNPTADLGLQIFNTFQSVLWINDSGFYSEELNPEINESGIYQLHIEVEGECDIDTTLRIEEDFGSPVYNSENGIIDCIDRQVPLIVNALTLFDSIIIISPSGNVFYQSQILTDEPGIHIIEITGSNGCKTIFNIDIPSNTEPPPLEIFSNDINCLNPESHLSYASSSQIIQQSWNDLNGYLSSDETITVQSPGWYDLEIININGCTTKDSIYVDADLATPTVSLLTDDPMVVDLFSNEDPLIAIEIHSSGNYQIQWYPTEGLSCDDCESPTLTGRNFDHYFVEVTAENGCKDSLDLNIRYEENVIVSIPNVFSPSNRDHFNDHFTLLSNGSIAIINECRIYDRWGELVFFKSDFPPDQPFEGWDGTFKGRKFTQGVYVYFFKVTTLSGKEMIYAGDVTLL